MKTSFLSRFTPSSMSAETLEKIFVKRHDLADDLVDAIRESATSENKHFRLLVGMRGIGKTHMVSLVYHRISQMEDLRDKLVIAWLREEEWGIDSFLSLLERIFRVVKEKYPDEYNQTLNLEVESLYELSPEEAELKAASLLKEFIGKRTLLIIAENLDILFQGLDDIGQKQLRAYIQNYSFISILATSQSLFDGIRRQDDPFYGFFYHYFLETLQINEAVDLLTQIAELEGDSELKLFIRTVTGYSRIRVIHHLAGGNPRIYVIFSQFITRKSLDELVEPFMQMLDDLTPYYQAKMQYLSSQQRKIIEFLVERRHPVIMTEIAKRCFITEQITLSQLKDLCNKGYVFLEKIGSESFYELREPLMRFCLEVKKQREESIRLFVDFLRCWYTKEELQQRVGIKPETITNGFTTNDAQAGLSLGLDGDLTNSFSDSREDFNYHTKALPEDAVIEREYIMKALEEMDMEEEENPRFIAYRKEFDNGWEKEDYADALEYARKLVENRGNSQDWILQGRCLHQLKKYQEALDCFDNAIAIKSDYENAWFNRGYALGELKRHEEAIESYDKAIEIKPDYTNAWNNRGYALENLGRYEEAIESYDNAIAIKPDYELPWNNRGWALHNLGKYEEAIESYDKAIAIKPDYELPWNNRGWALHNLGKYEEAIESYDKAIAIKPDYELPWNNRGYALNNLGRYEQALESCDKSIEIKPDYESPWNNRGIALRNLGRYEEAIESYDNAIAIKPDYANAWNNRGNALRDLGRYEEAMESYDNAIAIKPDYANAWNNRGYALRDLGRNEEAIESYDNAIAIKPDYEYAWFNRGYALRDLGRYEEAIESYDNAIAIKPDDEFAWFNRGYALHNLGRNEEAIESYDNAIAIKPDYTDAWNNRGIALGNLGRNEEAIESYDNAIAIKPDDEYAWNNRGNALHNLGRYEEAIESYDNAIAIKPDDEYAWKNRGSSLNDLKRYEEALESFDKAIEINPDSQSAWVAKSWTLIHSAQYEEALECCNKAISLAEKDHNSFANRAIALAGLNRWQESLISLEDAFKKLDEGKQASPEDTKLILRILFTNIAQSNIWKNHIQSIIQLFHQYKSLSPLSQGLVRNIPTLMSEMVSDKAVQTWLELWQELASDYQEFKIALQLLNTAVRYRQNKGDRRILLELPIEERKLLEDILS